METSSRAYHVYVGTYGTEHDHSLHVLSLQTSNLNLRYLSAVKGIRNPSYLTVNSTQDVVYACSEVEDGEVVSYRINEADHKLTEQSRQKTAGNGPCYVTLSTDETHLLTVNYGEGTTTVHQVLKDGSLGLLTDKVVYKQGSHPHTIMSIPKSKKYVVTDLGLDRLYLYEFNEQQGKLILLYDLKANAKSGPRHIAIADSHRKIYVVNEFNSKVAVYQYDASITKLELIQEVRTIPKSFEGVNYAADIHISHDMSYLYVSNRGHHSIGICKIDSNGLLTDAICVSSIGEWPRNFTLILNENLLLVANEHSNTIVLMKLGRDGVPTYTGIEYPIKSPVCLKALPTI